MPKALRIVGQPHDEVRLGDLLIQGLGDERWTSFKAAIAFAKASGVRHVAAPLRAFCGRGTAIMLIGVDHGGTSYEGLSALLDAVGTTQEVWIIHNELRFTFHPKLYLFNNTNEAQVILGSGNLTQGGLYTNYEASATFCLDLGNADDKALFDRLNAIFSSWLNRGNGTAKRLDRDLLTNLVQRGYVPFEIVAPGEAEEEPAEETSPLTAERPEGELPPPLFMPVAVRGAPAAPRPARPTPPAAPALTTTTPAARTTSAVPSANVFYMTLQRTDVGRGQTTTGTSARSPEIFIPLAARDERPGFWGWTDAFTEDSSRPGKFDRFGVKALLGSEVVNINMMTWPVKHDFRLRSEALRSAAQVGDILRIERVDRPDYSYSISIIPQGSTQYPDALAKCTQPVRNSKKRYGFE